MTAVDDRGGELGDVLERTPGGAESCFQPVHGGVRLGGRIAQHRDRTVRLGATLGAQVNPLSRAHRLRIGCRGISSRPVSSALAQEKASGRHAGSGS